MGKTKMKVTVSVEIEESDGTASVFARTIVPEGFGDEESRFADAAEQAAVIVTTEVKRAMEAVHGALPSGQDRPAMML